MTNIEEIGIYFISLEKDIKKRENLAKLFKKYFIHMKWIKAINGKELSTIDFYTKQTNYYKKNRQLISPSEIGCLMSHIKTLEAFLSTSKKYALIFEDDIIGTDADIEKILVALQYFDEDCFIYCGGMDGRNSSKYIFGKRQIAKNIFVLPDFSKKHLWRTCSYLVDKKSAKKILDLYNTYSMVADSWGELIDKKTATFATNIFHHPSDLVDSNIENERSLKITYNTISFKKVKNKIINIIFSLYFTAVGYVKIFDTKDANDL